MPVIARMIAATAALVAVFWGSLTPEVRVLCLGYDGHFGVAASSGTAYCCDRALPQARIQSDSKECCVEGRCLDVRIGGIHAAVTALPKMEKHQGKVVFPSAYLQAAFLSNALFYRSFSFCGGGAPSPAFVLRC